MLIEAWGEDGSLLVEALYSDFTIGTYSYRSRITAASDKLNQP